MTILNDQIQFIDADFSGLSDPVKKALTGFLGDYTKYFENLLNMSVTTSKQHAKNLAAQDAPLVVVLESYAAADEAKRASAEPFITDLVNHLNS